MGSVSVRDARWPVGGQWAESMIGRELHCLDQVEGRRPTHMRDLKGLVAEPRGGNSCRNKTGRIYPILVIKTVAPTRHRPLPNNAKMGRWAKEKGELVAVSWGGLCLMSRCTPDYKLRGPSASGSLGGSCIWCSRGDHRIRGQDQGAHRTTVLAAGPRRGYRGCRSNPHLKFAGYHEPPPQPCGWEASRPLTTS